MKIQGSKKLMFHILLIGLAYTGIATAFAKDCELEISYRKSVSSSAESITVVGVNESETTSISRNHVRYFKNRKSKAVSVEVSSSPGSSQRKWITLSALNQKEPVSGVYPLHMSLYSVRCPQSLSTGTTTLLQSGVQSCKTGSNGKTCSGNGQCIGTQCRCNADFSGAACETLTQRCYGAIGDNCGVADGFNFGFCAGNLCKINAGSWKHDECCVTYRVNGPMPVSQQGSCTPPPFAPPPYAQNCLVLFNMAVEHLAAPGLTWTRTVDTQKRSSGTGSFSVNHADMCNPAGGTLLCADTRMCCSRRADQLPAPNLCRCR